MRRLTRRQILSRLFIGFFTAASLLCTVNSAVAEDIYGNYKINNEDEQVFNSNLEQICPENSCNNKVEVNISGEASSSDPIPGIWGGASETDAVENNKVTVDTVTGSGWKLGPILGANVGTGANAKNNTLSISNSLLGGEIYGGWVRGEGDSASNSVTINNSAGSTISVFGGNTNTGDAASNTVNISDSDVYNVYGGYTATGDAASNTVNISDSDVYNAYGGYTATGDAVSNTVKVITDSNITGVVVGGYVGANGDAASNSITINSDVNTACGGNVIGTGNVTWNVVNIEDGNIQDIYGGNTNIGSATYNRVNITGGKVIDNIFGGFALQGEASFNTVSITDGEISIESGLGIAGANVGLGSATYNRVNITGGIINSNVYGSYGFTGEASSNTVFISGVDVAKSVYGGSVWDGDATYNTVEISGSSVTGDVYGGFSENGDAVTGNDLKISGANNTIGGQIVNFDSMTFDATGLGDGNTMLTLATTTAGLSIETNSINTINLDLYDGEKITLISSTAGNTYNDNISYRVNGKEAVKDSSSNKLIANVAEEDEDKLVYVNQYAYVKEDNNLNLYKEAGFVTGLYNGFDSNGQRQTLGQAEMTLKTVPNNVNKIYGAYSEDASVTAGGATVNLEIGDLSGFSLIGSENIKDPTKVDTKSNILNVNICDVAVDSVEGFGKLNFLADKAEEAEEAMLFVGSINLNGVNFNSDIPDGGFNGERKLLKGNITDYDKAVYTINNNPLNNNTFSIAKKTDGNVNIGIYKYGISGSSINLTGESIVAADYKKNGGNLSTDDKTLKVTGDIAKNYTSIYGAFNADGGAATGATVELPKNVAIVNKDLTIYGGYSTGSGVDVTTGNTLKISKNGNQINDIKNFSNIDLTIDTTDTTKDKKLLSLTADTVDLKNTNINVNITDLLKDPVTLIEANKELELADKPKFTINGKTYDTEEASKVALYEASQKYITVQDIKLSFQGYKAIQADENGTFAVSHHYTSEEKRLLLEEEFSIHEFDVFDIIYAVYINGNGDANGGKMHILKPVDFKSTTLVGGFTTGKGKVSDNILTVSSDAVGSKLKTVEAFSDIQFNLESDTKKDSAIIQTVEKVDLTNVNINANLPKTDLKKGEKLVLLDNTEKSDNATLKINGKDGGTSVAEDAGSFVAVSNVEYNTDDNKIAIECKDTIVAGNLIDEEGNRVRKENKLVLDSAHSNMRAGSSRAANGGSDPSGYEDIYGVYSAGDAIPTGAIVEIASTIDFSNSVVHGGGYRSGARYAKGNELIVADLNVKLKGVSDFETMTFNLPAQTQSGDTMLKVKDEVDMEPTKTVKVASKTATKLHKGDSVNLINSDAGIKNFGTQEIKINDITDKSGAVSVKDKALVFEIKNETQNENTKAPVEGIAAAMALVNQANTLVSEGLDKNMTAVAAAEPGVANTFAAMNGGHNKYETGSYVKTDSWNVGFGIAKKGLSCKNPDTTYGLFFQYGKSTFNTHNDGGYRGDGDSKMFGAGLMFHQEARSKYYYQGNIYAGKVDAKWNSKDGGYDDKATYYGMSFGMGRKHNAGGNKVMDIYGRYSFNHVGSMNGDINGLKYDFDSSSSHNLRFGLRMEYAQKNCANAYWGLAWEHEFAGDSTATVAGLGKTDSPTLNGNTGIVEVGYEWKLGDWNYSINAEGSFGKREGITGSFNINYNF